ncbi:MULTISPECIES: nitrite reductase small subunit NirD [Actinomadura]|uniref:Nitrite reductase (NADH) small subunit n=1 Tax=Actinomadura madurae TaxID=1993 RepID=A0A1I5HQC3_9ACTN|nr:nitrite reductase small subunit NirD [Actinomadura madurae]MCP9964304.1 nitrite reductase small subunit NirD [Actinomadura madurae]MCP9976790.1 nitrite reductase small subunit NirD [Actinomadura madurae]MCQ0011728.1 nitrite reductase small subunit NirD [Actinomadura madurae]MCQ0012970.1 nitrite reductase small subunit NirD [Actinomadura madurae]URM93204.1 nitrite reductase small subunit NirD [Actinomadura madurae]
MTTSPDATIVRERAVRPAVRWFDICSYAALTPERGACAMVEGTQVAIFRTFDGTLYALSNLDPFSGACVLSRGILGTRHGTPTVASPMYKQVFDLRTGTCLDDPRVAVPAFPVRRAGDRVEVALTDEHRQ